MWQTCEKRQHCKSITSAMQSGINVQNCVWVWVYAWNHSSAKVWTQWLLRGMLISTRTPHPAEGRMQPYDYFLRNPLTYSFRFLKQLPAGILFKSVDLYRRQCTDKYTVVCVMKQVAVEKQVEILIQIKMSCNYLRTTTNSTYLPIGYQLSHS